LQGSNPSIIREKLKDIAQIDLAKNHYRDYLSYVHRGLYQHYKHTLHLSKTLQSIAEGETRKVIVTMPPRHSKSMTITETFPSFYLGKNPNNRVITTAYGDSLARKFGRLNKQKVVEYGKELFDISLNDENASNNNWSLKGHRGGQLSTGIGGSITGEGADLLIVDDPYKNHEQAYSEVQRDKVWNEWQNTLLTRLQKGASVIIVQTRWHEDDLIGRLLKTEPEKWELVNFPAVAEEGDILGREVGDPLCPGLGYDEEWAESKKTEVGSMVWNSLYQQRPSAPEGNMLKRTWWKYYKELPGGLEEMLISVDATFKNKDTSDYCVLQVWGKKGADRYLIDQIRERLNFPETVQALRNLTAKYQRCYIKLIEDKANGSAVIDYLKNEISGLIPIEPDGSKESRVNAVSPSIESGNVYIPDPIHTGLHWVEDFVNECASFPNGKHDDMVDCMSQALNRWLKATDIFIGRA
jgi:predicted phage terminase large subunit-like protein